VGPLSTAHGPKAGKTATLRGVGLSRRAPPYFGQQVKLAASIGLVLAWGGWSELFLGALAGALLGAVYAQVLSARRGAGGRVYLPLGPFLLLGAFAAIALLPPPVRVPVSGRDRSLLPCLDGSRQGRR
jgi:hypothetical protein